MNKTENSIEARHLSKRYGKISALSDVTFTVKPGEIVGFLGPNGAGKSTTMRILSGLVPADAGSVRLCGISVANHPGKAKELIGYMPENNPLPLDLRVIEYLKHRAALKDLDHRKRRRRIEEVLEVCDLHRKASRKVIGTLSKGFRQRVGIADALLAEPPITLLDEPTIGLDPHQVLIIRKLIDQLRGRTTVMISSHILAEVEVSCDRVIIINHGRIVAMGAPDDLKREFRLNNQYILEFMGDRDKIQQAICSVVPDAVVKPHDIPRACDDEPSEFTAISIRTQSDKDIGEPVLHRLCNMPEVRVRCFSRKEPCLEDIFLAATRRSWEETLPLSRLKKTGAVDEGTPSSGSPGRKTPDEVVVITTTGDIAANGTATKDQSPEKPESDPGMSEPTAGVPATDTRSKAENEPDTKGEKSSS